MISVIIPFYNESQLVEPMVKEVQKALNSIGDSYEIIAVDDGSTDHTFELLANLKHNLPELKIVSFSRNFGLQAALTAGLDYANGEYVSLIDGDFQDPPELIVEMYHTLKQNQFDLVIGKRTSRNEVTSKRMAIRAFHLIFDRITDLEDIYNTGNFCMMKREVVLAILDIKESSRYFPGLRSFVGFKRTYLHYDRPDRTKGEAKMTFGKLLNLATDAIFSFSRWPIKICLWLGFMAIFLLLLAGIYTIVSKAANWAPLGWSSTILSIYFIGTIQLTFLGVIGEYLYRIYKEVQKRPLYIVRSYIS
ncbi:MAG: glycosyltransferase family 2 protein [Prolixibacteraceae bacterium]